jgi:hypothetical protein
MYYLRSLELEGVNPRMIPQTDALADLKAIASSDFLALVRRSDVRMMLMILSTRLLA